MMRLLTHFQFVFVIFKILFQIECARIENLHDYQRYQKEEALLHDLMTGYNPLIIPTPKNLESVKVLKFSYLVAFHLVHGNKISLFFPL